MKDLTDGAVFTDRADFERFVSKMKATLGLSENADRSDVLAEVRRLNKVLADYEAEQKIVVRAFGYDTWEDLMKSGAAIRAGVIMGMGQ
jgi:hypothetical protein